MGLLSFLAYILSSDSNPSNDLLFPIILLILAMGFAGAVIILLIIKGKLSN